MVKPTDTAVYNDFSGLAKLRAESRQNPEESLREVARQFEGIYLQMMLKSMREASLGDPLFDSAGSDMYRDMFDDQMALQLTQGKGLGLAELLVEQLRRNQVGARFDDKRQDLAAPSMQSATDFSSAQAFTDKLMPYAQTAANELGTTPQVILAQAALETGWGKQVITRPDGQSSYNLFNIKADANWSGERVSKNTLEYVHGRPQQHIAAFRAYDSYEAAFKDYVQLIKQSPRYQAALQTDNASDFAREVHAAGYATDPAYSDKWLQVMNTHFNPVEG